jgi:hypothetical protein
MLLSPRKPVEDLCCTQKSAGVLDGVGVPRIVEIDVRPFGVHQHATHGQKDFSFLLLPNQNAPGNTALPNDCRKVKHRLQVGQISGHVIHQPIVDFYGPVMALQVALVQKDCWDLARWNHKTHLAGFRKYGFAEIDTTQNGLGTPAKPTPAHGRKSRRIQLHMSPFGILEDLPILDDANPNARAPGDSHEVTKPREQFNCPDGFCLHVIEDERAQTQGLLGDVPKIHAVKKVAIRRHHNLVASLDVAGHGVGNALDILGNVSLQKRHKLCHVAERATLREVCDFVATDKRFAEATASTVNYKNLLHVFLAPVVKVLLRLNETFIYSTHLYKLVNNI